MTASPTKLNSADLLILPSGAIPMEFTNGPSVPGSVYQSPREKLLTQRIDGMTNDILLLQKQLRRVTRERNTYMLYVPRELLTMGQLIQRVGIEPALH